MLSITINNTDFQLHSYYKTDIGLNIRISDTTFSEISSAVDESATIQIGEEYIGYGLQLISMQTIENTIQCIFENTDALSRLKALETQVSNHASQLASQQTQLSTQSEDLEANAVAIAELAEIVGGNE